jgi:SAM-dependent methyltransferase
VPSDPPRPDPFHDTFVAPIAARAVVAAIELGVLDALAEEPATASELAERLGLDPVGVEALAAALVSLGYLEADGNGTLRPTAEAGRLAVRSSPESVATFAGGFARQHWEVLGTLEDALRGAPPVWHARGADDPLWEPYIRGLFELSREEHDANAALVPLEEPRSLLDLAGGHGAFAMAMCRRFAGLEGTVLELPGAARVGRRIVGEEGFAPRVSFREGDLFEVELGSGHDGVSTFNLLHHLPADGVLELFRRALAALRPGGVLVVGDTDRPPPGEPVSQVGALTGLAFYAESRSRTWTLSEIEGWLAEAGFEPPDVHRNERSPWRVMLAARRPG